MRRSAGSVRRYRKSEIVQTRRLRVSTTPNAIRLLITRGEDDAPTSRALKTYEQFEMIGDQAALLRSGGGP